MTESPMQAVPVERERRTIHLSSYVALGIDDVLDALSSPAHVERLLRTPIRAVLGGDADSLELNVGEVVRVSAGNASVSVSWSSRGANERLVAGRAEVAILVVQSGRDPLTELLLRIDVAAAHHRAVASALHDILDGVTDQLAGLVQEPQASR